MARPATRTISAQTVCLALAWLAWLWSVGNCLYVYLVLGGARSFRVESAVFILAAVLVPIVFWRASATRADLLSCAERRALTWGAVALWLVSTVPLLRFPFLSDDYVFLESYTRWSDVLGVVHFFRPLFGAVFLLLSRLGGGSALHFHVAGFAIHALTTCGVYVLAERVTRNRDVAALCFALFLLNPLQLEAVLWISGLQELLWTGFTVAALVVYTGDQTLSVPRILGTAALIGCALLSKETAVSSVLLIPAVDWFCFRMKRGPFLPLAYGMLGVVSAAYLASRALVSSIEATFFVTPDSYFAKQLVGAPYKFFVHPWNPKAFDVPPFLLATASTLVLGLLFRAVLRGAGPTILAGPAAMLASTLPVYSYFYVAPDLRGARYLYFAAAGWSLFLAYLVVRVTSRRWTLLLTSAALVLIAFVSLRVNLEPWRTSGVIVRAVAEAVRNGRPPESEPAAWQARYGPDLELKDGVPYVYKGVYLFVNGYPELRRKLGNRPPQSRPEAP